MWWKISCEKIITRFKPLLNNERNSNIENSNVQLVK